MVHSEACVWGCKSTLCRARQPWPQLDRVCMPAEHHFLCITPNANASDMLRDWACINAHKSPVLLAAMVGRQAAASTIAAVTSAHLDRKPPYDRPEAPCYAPLLITPGVSVCQTSNGA